MKSKKGKNKYRKGRCKSIIINLHIKKSTQKHISIYLSIKKALHQHTNILPRTLTYSLNHPLTIL